MLPADGKIRAGPVVSNLEKRMILDDQSLFLKLI